MAGNTQMNDSERGLFSLVHGITGMLIATVLLLSILAFLTINAIAVQQNNAETFYEVNQDLHALKMVSPENNSYRTIK
jgi:succinate dehydrogenase/fumarate reductase cytochrome b subunit